MKIETYLSVNMKSSKILIFFRYFFKSVFVKNFAVYLVGAVILLPVPIYGQNNVDQDDDYAYKILTSWNTAFQGEVKVNLTYTISNGWKFNFRYRRPLSRFECWPGKVESSVVNSLTYDFIVINNPYNKRQEAGTVLKLRFIGHYLEDEQDPKPPPLSLLFQGRVIYSSPELSASTSTNPMSVPTTDLMYVLNSLTDTNRPLSSGLPNVSDENVIHDIKEIKEIIPLTQEEINRRNNELNNQRNNGNQNISQPEFEGSGSMPDANLISSSTTAITTSTTNPSVIVTTTNRKATSRTTRSPQPTPVNVTTKYDYALILHKSILFYEAQRSGLLPTNKRLKWTRSSALQDRGNRGEDLTGGYYDAGDYVKFGYPMAFSLTLLSWSVIEYWDAYNAIGELGFALESIRWGADYLLKAHVSPYELYGQVGDAKIDHKSWGRPDEMRTQRPAFKITKKSPGADLAGETSAALSAASLAFRKTDGETAYVRRLINHATQLYAFSRNFRRHYHKSIPKAEKYYKSTNYKDEIVWAAAWLYRATGDKTYLKNAEGLYQNWGLFHTPSNLRFSWDDKTAGLQLLLSQISKHASRYSVRVKTYCNTLRSNRANYTTKGLLYLDNWSPLRYAANSAFLCLMAADNGIDSSINRAWGTYQMHYMLGDGGRSYVVGFGKKFPKRPHHRASSCPPRPQSCGWPQAESRSHNPIILEGALVGGPDKFDNYKDDRKKFTQSEVALDHNAGFQGALAVLQYRAMFPNGILKRSDEPWYESETSDSSGKGPRGVATTSKVNSWNQTCLKSLITILCTLNHVFFFMI